MEKNNNTIPPKENPLHIHNWAINCLLSVQLFYHIFIEKQAFILIYKFNPKVVHDIHFH